MGKGGNAGGKAGPKGGCWQCGGNHYASNCPKGKGKGKGVPTYSVHTPWDGEWEEEWGAGDSIPSLGCLQVVPPNPDQRGKGQSGLGPVRPDQATDQGPNQVEEGQSGPGSVRSTSTRKGIKKEQHSRPKTV